ncbi:MAG: aldolase [Methanomicrobiales archaeon]|nr:aldolase [Methanomicrobiales archaeon]
MQDQEFRRIGARLHDEGLVAGNFGNLSVKGPEGFRIKRSGEYLEDPGPPVLVPFRGPVPARASREQAVHRAIYETTGHLAVVHAHPPHAVALSLAQQGPVVPRDSEGQLLCPEIPVVDGEPGSDELARNVAQALAGHNVAIARGHGTFAGGATLEEAYLHTAAAEHSCRVLILLTGLERGTLNR